MRRKLFLLQKSVSLQMPKVWQIPCLKLRVSTTLDPPRFLLLAFVGCDCSFDSTIMPGSESKDYGDQFGATKLWTSILQKFYQEMPLKKHRRQLRIFNDTFTGRDGVDFLYKLLPGIWIKECTRNTASNLMQMFLKSNYLVNVRNEEDRIFHDNITLYSFCTHKIEEFISGTPFGDSAHFNGSSCRNVRRVSSFKAEVLESYRRKNCSSNASSSKKPSELDHSPVVSGRLSMSCGNLADICLKPERKHFGLGAVVAKGLFLSSPARSTKNPKTFNSTVVKENKSSPWRASNALFTRGGSKRQQLKNTLEPSVKPKTVAITDADEFKLWKYCLLERFKQAVGISNSNMLSSHFSGADVRWNCKMVGERGVVVRFPEHYDELATALVENLKKLASWPQGVGRKSASSSTSSHSTHKSDSPNVALGAERPVFAAVVRALAPLAPLIPVDLAATIVAIYGHFHGGERRSGIASKNETVDRTENRCAISTQTRQQRQQMISEQLILDIPASQREKFLLCIRLALLTVKPVIRRKLQIVLRYLRRIARNPHLRFRGLDQNTLDNRHCMLERLCSLFIAPCQGVSEVKSARFLAFLLDHLQELLVDVPHWLEADVQQRVDNLISGKEIMTVTGDTITLTTVGGRRSQESVFGSGRRTSRSSKTPPVPAAYCSRIGSSAYKQQKQHMSQDLLSLLDCIVADENMTPVMKINKLKTFQITYPGVYAQRFPQGMEDSNASLQLSATNSFRLTQGSGKKNSGGNNSSGLLGRLRQIMTAN